MNGFPKLRELEIQGGSELVLPLSIRKITTLKKLNLAAGDSEKPERIVLPESFGDLHGLEELTISCDFLEEETGCIGRLFLKKLDLRCGLTVIPESIGNIKSLKKLWIEAEIEEIPSFIEELTNLDSLKISSPELKMIPDFIGNLRNLKGLSLYAPQITTIPDSIGNLDKLVILRIHGENMGEVPSCINRLVSLEYLELCNMNIDELPEFLADLPRLKDINHSGSVIKKTPKGLRQFIRPWYW
jgi:Leucine-rich repeat (LRR) protein